jgi:hypothetical protein
MSEVGLGVIAAKFGCFLDAWRTVELGISCFLSVKAGVLNLRVVGETLEDLEFMYAFASSIGEATSSLGIYTQKKDIVNGSVRTTRLLLLVLQSCCNSVRNLQKVSPLEFFFST